MASVSPHPVDAAIRASEANRNQGTHRLLQVVFTPGMAQEDRIAPAMRRVGWSAGREGKRCVMRNMPLSRLVAGAYVAARVSFTASAGAQAVPAQADYGELAKFAMAGLQSHAAAGNQGSCQQPFDDCDPGNPFHDCNWHNANAVEAALDYVDTVQDDQPWVFDALTHAHCYFTAGGGNPWNANSIVDPAGYNDDALWWALAFIRGYDLTRDTSYLDEAESIFGEICSWWGNFDTSHLCGGGGVPWQRKADSQLNSITNELFLETAVRLHLRTCQTGNEPWCSFAPHADPSCGRNYIDWANDELRWFEAKFLGYPEGSPGTTPVPTIGAPGFPPSPWIADQLQVSGSGTVPGGSPYCTVVMGPYTYNNGVILGGLADMATAEQWMPNSTIYGTSYSQQHGLREEGGFFYLDQAAVLARNIIQGKTPLTELDPRCPACGPILTETDDDSSAANNVFDRDHAQFKGIFMRYLGRLDQWFFARTGQPLVTHDQGQFSSFITHNAASIWINARACAGGGSSSDQLGVVWNGHYPAVGLGQIAQTSALDALVAAAPYSAYDAGLTHMAVRADSQITGGCGNRLRVSHPASAAFDGDYSTYWCAEGPDPHWVEVEFLAPLSIEAVHVRHLGTVGSPWENNTSTFELRADSTTFATWSGNNCNASYVPNQSFASPGPVQASSLQMYVPANGGLAAEVEIEVYGTAAPAQGGTSGCGAARPKRTEWTAVGFLALTALLGLRIVSRKVAP
jgi:hypothetical protein